VKQYQSYTRVVNLLRWVELPHSSFYYKPKFSRRGIAKSIYTYKTDGSIHSNEQVVDDIKSVLQNEFCCYGYHNVTSELRDQFYIINPKKVYRLMNENNLLLGKVIRTSGKRQFVQHRKITTSQPMDCICLDIKYIWIDGEKRNYYLLTILDVHTRLILDQILQRSIRKIDVINAFKRVNQEHGIKGVVVRNDNGSQFIANDVKRYLQTAEAKQEFTHIATPEENAYIEAFHSIVQREVIDRFEFSSYYDALITFRKHKQWYNKNRKHGNLGRITPEQKWNQFKMAKFALLSEAETSSAGEQLARNNSMNGNDMGENYTPLKPQNTSFLFQLPKKTQSSKEEIDLNSNGDFV
jgi:transposase InsO family protein